MLAPDGLVIPLANYTLHPLPRITLRLHSPREIARAESARHGPLPIERAKDGTLTISLPLDASDFVQLPSAP